MTTAQTIALAGIVLSTAGTIMLFRFGMPYRVESRGVTYIITEEISEVEQLEDRHFRAMGNFGLALLLVGTALQAASVVLT